MVLRSAIVTAGLALAVVPDHAHAGKLESVRGEVRDSDASSGTSSSDSSGSWGDDDDSFVGSLDEIDVSLSDAPKYRRFPYADGRLGYIDRAEGRPPAHDDFGGSAHVEGAYLYDQLYRSGFGVDLDYWRLGFGSDLSFFLEGPFKDALYLGSSNLKLSLVMQPFIRWRIGGGAQYMIDGRVPGEGRREYAAGGNFTTDVDVFPLCPLVISGRFDIGQLYKAPSMLGRGTVGLMFNRFELYGGYEGRRIGKVSLRGPTLGLRAWF